MSKLWKPSRRLFLAGSAGLIAAPAIVRAGSLSLLGAGKPPGGVAWTPATPSGLLFWFEADSGVFVDAGSTLATNGQTVQQWNDQSGNGYHLKQATAGNRPTYNTTGLNSSKKAIVGNSATLNMGLQTVSQTIALNSSSFSVYIVFADVTAGNGAGFYRIADIVGTTASQDFNHADSWQINQNANVTQVNGFSSNGVGGFTNTVVSGTALRYGGIVDGVHITDYINGTQVSQVAQGVAGPFGNTTASLGCLNGSEFSNNNNAWNGPISVLIGYSAALSTSDRTSMDSYLAGKWV